MKLNSFPKTWSYYNTVFYICVWYIRIWYYVISAAKPAAMFLDMLHALDVPDTKLLRCVPFYHQPTALCSHPYLLVSCLQGRIATQKTMTRPVSLM